jgi:tetratricopeptide (TPR) repeat protein
MITPLVEAANKTGYCPVIAEALLAEAHATGRRVEPTPEYRSHLEDALWRAEDCGHDRVRAIAAAELAFVDRFKTDASSTSWARMAESVLNRMGGDVGIQSWLENNRAVAANSQGRFDEAVKGYEKALALKRSEVGPDHLEYAIRLGNLSDALKGAGRLDEALTASNESLAVMLRWLGPDHIDIGMAKNNRGDLLVALNRTKEAEVAYSDAITIFRERLAPDDSFMPYPLAGMGMALLKEDNARAALPLLEEAARMNVGGDRYFASEIKFALARALMADGADRRRAVALARAAEETYRQNSNFKSRRREISDWISSHENSRSNSSSAADQKVVRLAD